MCIPWITFAWVAGRVYSGLTRDSCSSPSPGRVSWRADFLCGEVEMGSGWESWNKWLLSFNVWIFRFEQIMLSKWCSLYSRLLEGVQKPDRTCSSKASFRAIMGILPELSQQLNLIKRILIVFYTSTAVCLAGWVRNNIILNPRGRRGYWSKKQDRKAAGLCGLMLLIQLQSCHV